MSQGVSLEEDPCLQLDIPLDSSSCGGGGGARKRRLPEQYPSFAAILSFLSNYALLLGCVGELDFNTLSYWFRNDHPVGDDFVDFVVNLLKRLQKKASSLNWQESLASIYRKHSEVDWFILRTHGFHRLTLHSRLEVFKNALESQFDSNEKFRALIEDTVVNGGGAGPEEMRVGSLGSDECGHIYWYFQDSALNILLYREEPDDHTQDSFTLLARTIEQFECIVTKLENKDFSPLEIKELQATTPTSVSGTAKQTESTEEIIPECSADLHAISLGAVGSNSVQVTQHENSEPPIMKSEQCSGLESHQSVEVKEEKLDNHQFENDPESGFKEEDSNGVVLGKTEDSIPDNASSLATEDQTLARIQSSEQSKIEDKVKKEETDSINSETELNSVVSSEDFEKRRSSRIRSTARNCYSVEERFKLIYSQAQVTPKKKRKSVDVANEGSCKDGFGESEDAPLSTLPKKGKKRGRKRKKRKEDEEVEEERQSGVEEEELEWPGEEDYKGCGKCLRKNRPDTILLCDGCDCSMHMACLRPPLFLIPEQEWFCPACAHDRLLSSMRHALTALHQLILTNSRKRRYVSSSIPLGFPSAVNVQSYQVESPIPNDYPVGCLPVRSLREKRRVNYGYDEYDQEIKAAIRAHNSPVKNDSNGQGYSSDNSSTHINSSPNKHPSRYSKRLNFVSTRSQSNQNSRDVTDDENTLDAFDLEKVDGFTGHSDRNEEHTETELREEQESQERVDNQSNLNCLKTEHVFSALIAETSCEAPDISTTESNREVNSGDVKREAIGQSEELSDEKQPKEEAVEHQTAQKPIILNGRRSPVKVGKLARLERIRQMHEESHLGDKDCTNVQGGDMIGQEGQDPHLGRGQRFDDETDSEPDENSRVAVDGKVRDRYMRDEDFVLDEDVTDSPTDDKSSCGDLEDVDSEFEADEKNPWKRRKKKKKETKENAGRVGKRKERMLEPPARVSSRLSSQHRVKYSEDPYADDLEDYGDNFKVRQRSNSPRRHRSIRGHPWVEFT